MADFEGFLDAEERRQKTIKMQKTLDENIIGNIQTEIINASEKGRMCTQEIEIPRRIYERIREPLLSLGYTLETQYTQNNKHKIKLTISWD